MEHKGTVLLVEDNEALNIANSRALRLRGYEVDSALTLAEARKQLSRIRPDIILLDVMLPDGDGMAFCKEIRSDTTAHILFLTAKTEHEDMVRGLCGGGDDYITKPFHPEELLARIDAVMRRRGMENTPVQVLETGELRLEVAASRATWRGEDLELTPKEFLLLYYLAQNKGSAIDKSSLYEKAWKQPMLGNSNALRQHIYRLKYKLETISGGAYTIFASRTEGYMLDFTE